jgi:hypothetical protein
VPYRCPLESIFRFFKLRASYEPFIEPPAQAGVPMAMRNVSGRANGDGTTLIAKATRCVIYTRKSTDEGLQQEFNSLDAQREAAEAFILSQRHEGWQLLPIRMNRSGALRRPRRRRGARPRPRSRLRFGPSNRGPKRLGSGWPATSSTTALA